MKKKLLIGIFIIGILINVVLLLDTSLLFNIYTSGLVGGLIHAMSLTLRQVYHIDSGTLQLSIHRFIGILFFLWAIFMTIRSNQESNRWHLSNVDTVNQKSINRKKFTFLILFPAIIIYLGSIGGLLRITRVNILDYLMLSPILYYGIGVIWTILSYYFMRARCADFNNDAKWITRLFILSIVSSIFVILLRTHILDMGGLTVYRTLIGGLDAVISSIMFYTIVTLIFYPGVPKKSEDTITEEGANFHTNPINKA